MLNYEEHPHPTRIDLNHHGLPWGIVRVSEDEVLDKHTGLTLEACERCGEYDEPQDDSCGLCRTCLAAGFIPSLRF